MVLTSFAGSPSILCVLVVPFVSCFVPVTFFKTELLNISCVLVVPVVSHYCFAYRHSVSHVSWLCPISSRCYFVYQNYRISHVSHLSWLCSVLPQFVPLTCCLLELSFVTCVPDIPGLSCCVPLITYLLGLM